MQKVDGLTIHTITNEGEGENKGWRRKDFILSVLLILFVGAIWVYFS